MANNLSTRISALERKTAKMPKVFNIICKGATPTPEELKKIDEAEKRGEFVICRLIATPEKNH
ncbi:MAG: hypothetical protein ACYC2E_08960 [Sulfuricella sp.]